MNTAVGAFGLKGRSSAETRSAVLDMIRSDGELSRTDLYAVGLTLDVDGCIAVLCGLDGNEIARTETDGTGQDDPAGEVYRLYARAVLEAGAVATSLFRRTAQYLAVAINDVVNTLDLARVTLAGPGFAKLRKYYRNVVETRLADYAFMRALHPITVRLSRGRADAAALGAASVVLHRQLTPHQAGVPA